MKRAIMNEKTDALDEANDLFNTLLSNKQVHEADRYSFVGGFMAGLKYAQVGLNQVKGQIWAMAAEEAYSRIPTDVALVKKLRELALKELKNDRSMQ